MLRFQSTFPRGERPFSSKMTQPLLYFNPRSLVGNDDKQAHEGLYSGHFNPRSLVGNDKNAKGSIAFNKFQSTFPRGERQRYSYHTKIYDNFNPRSLVGNDIIACYHPILPIISIHVPSWGTTVLGGTERTIVVISIHVPSWGTTGFMFV